MHVTAPRSRLLEIQMKQVVKDGFTRFHDHKRLPASVLTRVQSLGRLFAVRLKVFGNRRASIRYQGGRFRQPPRVFSNAVQ